jgi:RHS repeat-associated protein
MTKVQAVARAISDGARKTASLTGKVASGGVASAEGALAQVTGSGGQSFAFPTPGYGSGGTGPGGSFSTTPPPTTQRPPGVNLPNLDEMRNAKPQQPRAKAPIESNLMCADCDPYGGGGGAGNYPSGDPNFSGARGRPINETGEPGVDLGSRNFNWGMPLLHLPGRAGLDLDLTLFYNSLVWTRDGSYMKFNADLGSPAPGFHLGLPTLQQRFLNSQTNIYAYMMVTPSGGRVELRQVGTSSIYESQDSTYAQLDATNTNLLVVRTTDGTQFTFVPAPINNEYRCTEIKDRNGNYITATYNGTNGHLETITDTLNRLVTFVYDASSNLQAIRQTWNGTAHDWATFNYGQVWVAPAFGGGLLVNGPNGNYTTVLTQVNLQDGSYFTFEYNSTFAQVNRINRYAADGHLLAYTSYNVSSAAGQTDCPRFTERHDWAENWNNHNEVVTGYSAAGDGSWTQQTAADGTIYKEFFAISGWQTGLTTSSEFWSGGVKKKWTTIAWTQDDTSLSYQKNPRPYDTSIYDEAGNRRRTEIVYTSFNLPNPVALPTEVKEYAANGTTVQRRTATTYYDLNLQAYIDRRVLGLLRSRIVYDENNQPQSKVWFDYDWNTAEYWAALPQGATQHDGASVPTGRGNLCWIGRWDVTDIDNSTKITAAYTKYNRTGSVIKTEDHYGVGTTISYGDSFSDAANRNTFAYPTTVTDADGYSSFLQYNYDFGGVTRTQDPKGAVQTINYDTAARLERITNQFNGAYTRWVYATGSTFLAAYSTIEAGQGEAFEGTSFDGAGRYRSTQVELPGSVGGYSAVITGYDVMGRPKDRSNPTEINAFWSAAGDDATTGWVWTNQSYDWKGRPTVTTNPDGTTRENTYSGCGCAGGEVVTVRDERGRRRKLTMDVLGRLKQVDELNWDQSVYATTIYTYNARDQLTQINHGGQTRTFSYDGFGRLATRTTPEQGATTYTYFLDDRVQTVTDARGATTTFGYNNRRLVTGITYGVPTGVESTANVTFEYDAAGNRTSMIDGLGSASYVYNTISQLTSETRSFTNVGSYTLTYGYNLAGQLNSVSNPWGAQVGYSYDKTGRPSSVSGSGYAGVSSYVSSFAYRAFGLKQMNYANGRSLSVQYDNRMRPTQWNIPGVMGWNYAYTYFGENTGRVTYAQNLNDSTLDRSYDYDHVGRLIAAKSGAEARVHVEIIPSGTPDGPYSQTYEYDQWGNMVARTGRGGENSSYATVTYTNNKRNGLTYDAAGNLTNDGGQNFTYDATGQAVTATYGGLHQYYDGDGLRVKKIDDGITTYYLRSSVLGGQVVAEISGGGSWQRGYVYLGGQLLAVQQQSAVSWIHEAPVVKSKRVTNSSGNVVSTIELDPWGGNTNRSNSDGFQPRKFTTYERDGNASDEAMFRRYNRWWSRFDQPDPYDGSYDLTNPESFNRYAYTGNDPVNFVDPLGLDRFDDPLGPPPPMPTLIPYGGTIVTNTSVPRPSGGGSILGDVDFLPEEPSPEGGGGELTPVPLPLDLKDRVAARVNNPARDCADLVRRIIDEASRLSRVQAYSNNPLTIFDRIQDEGGFHLAVMKDSGQADFTLRGKRVVYINQVYESPDNARAINHVQNAYANTALNEIMHHAASGGSVYNDRTLARALFNTMTRVEQAANQLPKNSDKTVNGRYFHNFLTDHCPAP